MPRRRDRAHRPRGLQRLGHRLQIRARGDEQRACLRRPDGNKCLRIGLHRGRVLKLSVDQERRAGEDVGVRWQLLLIEHDLQRALGIDDKRGAVGVADVQLLLLQYQLVVRVAGKIESCDRVALIGR